MKVESLEIPQPFNQPKLSSELMQLTNELSISGMPVVDNGKLMGIVTRRDFRYADNLSESSFFNYDAI